MSISNRAVLVNLSITQWSARKLDKKITHETNTQHGVDSEFGRYNKRLVAKEALDKLASIANAARAYHYQQTLPWDQSGARILASLNMPEYQAGIRKHRQDFEDAAASFVAGYPDFVADARRRLNGAFDEADYPTVTAVAGRFAFTSNMLPMPDTQDFRVQLSAEELASVERDINARVSAACRDVWDRVHEAVGHMATKLKEYGLGADGKVTGAFRDSLVGNVCQLAELLPRLNVTGDAKLDELAKRLRAELCAEPAEVLRTNPKARADVAARASQILADMGGYV